MTSARLHVTAWGTVEMFLNGSPVGEDVLEPGWSSYQWRLRYRSYDVSHLLQRSSVLVAVIGNGWYRGRLGWGGQRAVYGDQRALLAQLEIEYDDGTVQTIATDARWQSAPSPVLDDDLYDGQSIDARRPGIADASAMSSMNQWRDVVELPTDLSVLVPAVAPPVRRIERRSPVAVDTRAHGRHIVDFGQNLVGWVQLRVQGRKGQQVEVRHSEVLQDGELAVRPLRSAKAIDRYVLSGEPDLLEPTFTSHGFRYAEVSGWPGPLTPDMAQAVVVHTALPRTGTFRCSNAMLNQLHDNVVWSARGNFLSLPTDCPQRDERLGWTGDISVFAATAAFLFDVEDFLADWLQDLAAEQRSQDGRVPNVVPDLFALVLPEAAFDATAVWGDAAVWVPWALWQAYGNRALLAAHYDSMAAHVRFVLGRRSERGLVDETREYGDWLDPDAPPDKPWQAKTPAGVVATACLFRSCTLTAQAAAVLGHETDATGFLQSAAEVRGAFQHHYVHDGARVEGDAATAYALAIHFGLLEPQQVSAAGARLATLVEESGYCISTGFAGTPFVCDALVACGYLDQAYRLLLQREAPSWLYPVTLGATTVWERWDSLLPDGSINSGEMTSFNHYALGAVADWMHRVVGGISPLEPGYSAALIAPKPGGDLTWSSTSLETRHGRIAVDWSVVDDRMRTAVQLPDGVRAVVAPGGAKPREVIGGSHEILGPAS